MTSRAEIDSSNPAKWTFQMNLSDFWNIRLGIKLASILVVFCCLFSSDLQYAQDPVVNNKVVIVQKLEGHSDAIYAVAFSPDGKLLASGSADGTIMIWNVTSRKAQSTLKGGGKLICSLCFSPDNRFLASGSADQKQAGDLVIWDTSSGEKKATLKGHRGNANAVSFCLNGSNLACGSSNGTVQLWNVKSTEIVRTVKAHRDGVLALSSDKEGKQLVTGGWDMAVKVWNASSGIEQCQYKGHTNIVWSVAFAPTGGVVASCGQDRTVRLWDIKSGEQKVVWVRDFPVRSLSFTPRGEILASGSFEEIKFWDVSGLKEVAALELDGAGFIYTLAFSPNGDFMASGAGNGVVQLWDTSKITKSKK